jgi:hypothetical protein
MIWFAAFAAVVPFLLVPIQGWPEPLALILFYVCVYSILGAGAMFHHRPKSAFIVGVAPTLVIATFFLVRHYVL